MNRSNCLNFELKEILLVFEIATNDIITHYYWPTIVCPEILLCKALII